MNSSVIRRTMIMVVAAATLAIGGLVGPAFSPAASSSLAPASAASLSGYPTLRNGSSGTPVRVLQHLLNGHGQSIDVDGAFGPATEGAVKNVQSAKGTDADGIVGPATWGVLVPTLRSGDTGNLVKALQASLNERGASLEVDGDFGPATASAVEAAQGKAGLSQDGIAGPDTWRALVTGSSGGGGGDGDDPEGKYANGELPDSALCSISYASSWRLACYTIDDYEAMNDAFRAARGKDLPITHSSYTAYRTVADQQYLWDNCPTSCAYPGTSNHGLGKAIDISVTNGDDEAWLAANAESYGFIRDVAGEPWHFHYIR